MSIIKEEKSALGEILNLMSLVTEIPQLILDAMHLLSGARLEAFHFVALTNDSQTGRASRSYLKLKVDVAKLPQAAEKTEEALKFMRKSSKPLKRVEVYSQDLINKLRKSNLPAEVKQTTEEKSLLAFSAKVESGMALNIQRCEAIKTELKNLIKNINLPPTINAESVRRANVLVPELEKIEGWYTAAFHSLNAIEAAVQRAQSIEMAAIQAEMLAAGKR